MTAERFVPADQDARDLIASGGGGNLFVDAGAGSGKTTALVSRIVQLVRSGEAQISGIAAITFTELAAGELRDRIRSALETAAAELESSTGAEAVEMESSGAAAAIARLRRGARDVESAAIQTIHGFCRRLLAEEPIAAGLPPGFEVMDDVAASVAFQDRWDSLLDRLLGSPPEELRPRLRLALALGLQPGHLLELAGQLRDNYDRLPDKSEPRTCRPAADLTGIDLTVAVERIGAALAMRDRCTESDDKLFTAMAQLPEYRDRLAAAARADDSERIAVLRRWPAIGAKIGLAANWGGDVESVRTAVRAAKAAGDSLLDAARESAFPPIIDLVEDFIRRYADERRRMGRIEFHDLLVLARNLLRDSAAARRRFHHEFTHLFVDEFQDTDPLQVEIVFLLAQDWNETPQPWRTAPVQAGRLFLVGDPKQSIYGFRRADVSLYLAVRELTSRSSHNARLESLSHNFRSVVPVIDFVNVAFERIMPEDDPDRGRVKYSPLQANRSHDCPERDDDASVLLLGERLDGSAEEVRRAESAALASVIRGALANGWVRRLSEIALLIPTRTAWPIYEEALEEECIPYRLEAKSLVYSSQDVRDLVAILRAVDDPTDEVALVAALRTPGFACSDADLLRWRQAGGSWTCYAETPAGVDADGAVANGLEALRRLRQVRFEETIAGLLERIVRERRLLELAVATPRPRERWARIAFLLDQARAFDETGSSTLRPFLDWVERRAEESARTVESPAPEPDDDAVRVLTIHAAKGLEFPMVVLAGLNGEGSSRKPCVLWRAGGSEIRIGPEKAVVYRTPGYDEALQTYLEREKAEEQRLLYVGMTRAMNRLVLSLHHRKGKKTPPASHARDLWEIAQEMPDRWKPLNAEAFEPEPASDEPEPAAQPIPTVDERTRWLEERKERIERFGTRAVVSATGYAGHGAPPVEKDEPDPGDEEEGEAEESEADASEVEGEERPGYRRARGGTSIGRAVHAVLQSIDLATGDRLPETAVAQARAENIADQAAEVARLARIALGSSALREAVSGGGRRWREVYVGATIGETVIEGFIDLLYERPDGGLSIVDYKTDSIRSDEELDIKMKRYSRQGALYALALERALGRPVADCSFVFLRYKSGAERPIPNLRAAVARVEADLMAAGNGTEG
jgi:ATP-dependent helicase/nuclease subunit A